MFKNLLHLVLVLVVTACATHSESSGNAAWEDSLWGETSGVFQDSASKPLVTQASSHWYHHLFPGKQATIFKARQLDGRNAIEANAISSASMLRRKVSVAAEDLGVVRFSWKVPALIAIADMAQRDLDDSPVRIVLAFEGDRSKFSTKNAILNELSLAVTGEEMPYAVMMYVWSKQRPLGTVINSPRTDRIRKLVVEADSEHLNQWQDYERNIKADFERLYGEPPGALLGMGIMTDTDNTHTTTQSWYGPLQVMMLAHPAEK